MTICNFLYIMPSLIFGVLIGNYMTTLLFRLPKNIQVCGINNTHDMKPCCSICFHKLKVYEYLPILSWIFARFQCNYCGIKINPHYFILEFSTAIISVILSYIYGYSELYILLILFFAISMLASLIHIENNGRIMTLLTCISLGLGILYRTLIDHSILPWIVDLSLCGMLMLSLLQSNRLYANIYRNEMTHIFLQISVWIGGVQSLIYIMLIGIIYFISVKKYNTYRYCNAILIFVCCAVYSVYLKK